MISEIKQDFFVETHFKYVPTAENPADFLFQGISLQKFQQTLQYWTYGPKWIAETPINWSKSNLECLSPRSKDLVKSTVFHNTISDGGVLPTIPYNRFSNLEKLIKATEFAFRFIHKARQLNASDPPGHNARIHLFKIMQQQTFQKEITYLKDPRDTPPDLVKNFNIFLDDEGILRMDGRIAQTLTYEYEQIYPILLVKYHPLIELLITDCHERCKHLGIDATLTKLRLAGFWAPQARQAVKKVISKCFTCKKFSNQAYTM